jgi:hypothetical protein
VTNDPDLLDEECRDCFGSGWSCLCSDDSETCECPFDTYSDCPTCNGNGVVLRG